MHGGSPSNSRLTAFVSEDLPGKSSETSDAKVKEFDFQDSSRNPGNASYLAPRCYFFSKSMDFEEFPGLEKVGFGLTALYFHNFSLKNYEKVHGVLEF